MGILEKAMNIWAKITSLLIMVGLIYWIYLTIQIFLLPSQTPIWIYSMPLWWISGLVFYSPFFYYGWIKKPNNKHVKLFTKFITIIYSLAIIFSSISYSSTPQEILFILPSLAFITPLYYYAWK